MSSITNVPDYRRHVSALITHPNEQHADADTVPTLEIGVNVGIRILDGVAHAGACSQMADVCDRRAVGFGLLEDFGDALPVAYVHLVERQPSALRPFGGGCISQQVTFEAFL